MRASVSISRSTMLILAIALLSDGNMFGRFYPGTTDRVIAAVLVLGSGALAYASRWSPPGPASRLTWAVGAGTLAAAMYREPLAAPLDAIAVLAVVVAIFVPTRFSRILLVGVAALVVSGIAAFFTIGHLKIDVFTMIQGAAGDFIHGRDPYRTRFPTADFSTTPASIALQPLVYGPSVVLLSAPGRLLGDVRFAGGLMWLITALACATLARRTGRPGSERGLAALMITLPMAPTMIYLAWADIYGLAMLAAWAALRPTHRRVALVCLGLCLAAKPTLGALLLLLLLWSPSARKDAGPAVALAAIVTLPFAVWDGFNFWQSTVGTVFNRTVYVNRVDAININALVHVLSGRWVAAPLLLLMTAALAIPILLTRPRDGCDIFALGAALTTAVLATGRPAFLNYYFVAAVALLLALAVEPGSRDFDEIRLAAVRGNLLARVSPWARQARRTDGQGSREVTPSKA